MTTVIENALRTKIFERTGTKEYWLNTSGDPETVTLDLNSFLDENAASAVSIRMYGGADVLNQTAGIITSRMAAKACPPLMLLQDDLEDGAPLAMQVHAVSGIESQPIYFKDEFTGRRFEDKNAVYLMLRVLPDDEISGKFEQAENLFAKAEQILQNNGTEFEKTIRTWLYADDILAWYGDLNKARNAFFEKHDIYDKLVPASTGIGACNPQGRAMATQVLAVIPKDDSTDIQKANSPLQCPALNYRSSFSRAVKLSAPGYQRLFISGTASIDPDGNTVNLGDTPAQIELTMKVVHAILKDAGFDWNNVASSIVYFKYREEFDLFNEYCRKHQLELPHVKLHADVCRDNLLFELELDAIKSA